MIRAATAADEAEVLAAFRASPAIGAQCEMYWRLVVENPHIPHRFFVLGGGGVAKLFGSSLMLCGTPQNPEELCAFLRFNRVGRVTALGWRLPGWQLEEEGRVLVRPAGPATGRQVPPPPEGFDPEPPVEAVMDLLAAGGGFLRGSRQRESFWVDFHIRRNHGVARVAGIWREERLAATAGVWAITERQGYVACVETGSGYRRRGYATALLGWLCEQYAGLELSLMCGDGLAGFYSRFGFEDTGLRGCVSRREA